MSLLTGLLAFLGIQDDAAAPLPPAPPPAEPAGPQRGLPDHGEGQWSNWSGVPHSRVDRYRERNEQGWR